MWYFYHIKGISSKFIKDHNLQKYVDVIATYKADKHGVLKEYLALFWL